MLSKLTSRGPTAKDRAKESSDTLREVMHTNAVGVAALAARVAELEAELKTTKAALALATTTTATATATATSRQVLVSIQALVLCEMPYFNEAG